MKKEYLECGKVCSAHGVRGVMKVEPWCDSPKVLAMQKRVFLAEKDGSFTEHRVVSASVSGGIVLMSIEGIDTREAASAMKNITLYLHRADIPLKAGQMLVQDMIGLEVRDIDTGRLYGKLKDTIDGARSMIYVIETSTADVLLPAIPEFVKEISEERGILIRTIPGFFDDAE